MEAIRDMLATVLVAGTGMTITVNDAGDTITLVSSGGGSALTVKDEGSNLDTAVTSLDFVGSGVVATNSGHAVTVTIAGGGGGSGGALLSGSGPPFSISGSAPAHRASVQTANIPATAQGGDTLLAFVFQNSYLPSDASAATITGWTLVQTDAGLDSWNGGGIRLTLLTKTAAGATGSTSSEAGNAFTPSGTSYAGAWCMAYSPSSGVHAGRNHNIDSASTVYATLATGAISATYNNSRIVQAQYGARGGGGGTLSATIDGTTTPRQTYADTHTSLELKDETQSTAGAVRTATWTLGGQPLVVVFNVVLDPLISTSTGSDGDFYIDLATGNLYGPKASGSWPTTPIAVSGYTDENARDAIGTALTDGSGVHKVVDDAGNTITLERGPLVINTQTGTSYTAVLTDAPKFITMSNGSASTFTIPPNSSVAFPIGTVLEGAQLGSGQVTLTPGSGVTVNGTPGLKIASQYGTFAVMKIATDTWIAFGRLAP